MSRTDTAEMTYQDNDELARYVMLVNVQMSYFHGTYRLKDAEVRVDGHVPRSTKTTQPSAVMMAATPELERINDEFQSLASEKNSIVNYYAETAPLTGCRIIARGKREAFLYELIGKYSSETGRPVFDALRSVPFRTGLKTSELTVQSVGHRFWALADRFCQEYPRYLQDMAQAVDSEVWSRIKRRLPAPASIRSLFGFNITKLSMDAAGDRELDAETMHQYDAFIRQSAQQARDQIVEQIIAGPRQQIVAAVQEFQELVNRDGRVTSRSLNPIREAIDRFRMFNVTGDNTIEGALRALEARLDAITPSELDSTTAASSGLNDILTAVTIQVGNELKQAEELSKFGRRLRSIDI